MQTKLKPLFFLVTLAATALLLYTANDARAQGEPIGLFNMPALSPSVITISPKLGHPQEIIHTDTLKQTATHEALENDH